MTIATMRSKTAITARTMKSCTTRPPTGTVAGSTPVTPTSAGSARYERNAPRVKRYQTGESTCLAGRPGTDRPEPTDRSGQTDIQGTAGDGGAQFCGCEAASRAPVCPLSWVGQGADARVAGRRVSAHEENRVGAEQKGKQGDKSGKSLTEGLWGAIERYLMPFEWRRWPICPLVSQ